MRLIDADALKKLRHDYIQGRLKFNGSEYDLIDKCPTIDAVPVVHGRWITEDADAGEVGAYSAFLVVKCPECDYDYSVESGQYGWYWGDPFPYHYCPNCGAKMDLEVDGE